MASVQEQLKLKRLPIDSWSVKEQLCLASAVVRSGDQNWMSVSRSLKPFGEPSRPPDWFSQKSCALQYGNLLENVETPKRKKRTDKTGNEHVETPGESIVRNLTHERINELKRLLQDGRSTYLRLKEDVIYIKAGHSDDRLGEMCQQIEEEKKQKEKESEAHVQWLRDRQEKKLELERAWKPPASSSLRKKLQRRMSGNRRNSSQSEPSSEAESAVDSPLSEQLNVDVIGDETNEAPVVEAKPVAPTPTSPLLTSLLKSPSPAPSAQNIFLQSSILHSAITSAHHRPSTSSPTIASLLNSSPSIPPPTTVSPSLKNLVTSAIGAAANEESPKPVSSSPAAGAPTLSMLLELPPSLPGKPLPELPQPFPSTTTTTKPGEVCHPQHQEMRVRSEPGTDEPVEVVEVEQQVTHEVKVEEVEMKFPTESSQVTPSARAATPRPNHRINRKLFAEVEPTESEEPAAEVVEEAEVKTEEKPGAEMIKDDKQKDKEESPQKLEEQGTEIKKEEDEPESKKQENGLAEEDIKRIMDMPVVMGSEIQEAVATEQTVTEVIEVPAAPAGDLDIFIMDSTSVGNQEEVPVVTDIKLDDDDDNAAEEEVEEQNDTKGNEVEAKKKAKTAVAEEKTSNVSEGKSAESTVAVANQVSKQENNFDVGESSRIEVVAIEIPSSELETKDADKDISFEDLEKDLYKEEMKKEDENDEKETSQQRKSDENIDKKAGQEAPEEKTNEEENMDAKEKDTAIQEEVKEKTDILKDIDIKKEIKDEQEEKDDEEKTSDKEEKTSKVETDTESIEDSSKEEQQVKNVTEESVNDVPKVKESKKQEEEKKVSKEEKKVPKEESGEEDEAEGHEDGIQTTAINEEDKTAEVETTAEQPSEALGASNKNWKAEEEEEEEDEEKKEAEKSESEEAKTSPEKQKPASTSLRAETPSTEDDKTNDAVEPARTGTSRKRGTTSTPVDSIPNSPAAPLTDEDREYRTWKKAIMLLYGRLATHKYASLFLRPITDDQAPGYSSIVHRPIDLLTIKKNIETGVTRTTAEFQRDVMLMFLNSIMYNKSSYHVHAMAREMQREGMQHIQDFLTTQMLVQVSEAPLRRETRTTEAHKRGAGPSSSSSSAVVVVAVAGGGGGGGGGGGEHLSTPGSSSQEETEASISTPSNKRKRPDPDRNSTSKKRRGADSSRRHQHTEGDSSKQQTIDKYYKKL